MPTEIETNIFVNFISKGSPTPTPTPYTPGSETDGLNGLIGAFTGAQTGDFTSLWMILGAVFLFALGFLFIYLGKRSFANNYAKSSSVSNQNKNKVGSVLLHSVGIISIIFAIVYVLFFSFLFLDHKANPFAFAQDGELQASSQINATYDAQNNTFEFDKGWLKAVGNRNLYIKGCSITQTEETKSITDFSTSNLKIEALGNFLYDAQPNGEVYSNYSNLRALEVGVQEDMSFALSNYSKINSSELNGKNLFIIKFVLDSSVSDDPIQIDPNTTYNGNEVIAIDENGPWASIEGTYRATEPGDYSFTVTLQPGWKWSDGTTGPKEFKWSIKDSQEEIIVIGKDDKITYDGKEHFGYVEVSDLPEGYYLKDAGTTTSVTHYESSAKSYTCDILIIENKQGKDVTDKLNIIKEQHTLQIIKKDLNLTSTDEQKIYDGKPLSGKVNVDGLVGGEELTCNVTSSITNAGSQQNLFEFKFDKSALENDYNLIVKYGTLTVNKRNLLIDTENLTLPYDGKEHSSTYNVQFLVEGETLILDTPKLKNAGYITSNYTINPSSTANLSNYVVVENLGTLTIEPKEVSIKSLSAQKNYDGTVLERKEIEYVDGKGFIEGEGATYSFTGQQLYPGKSDNTFSYSLNEWTLQSNYSFNISYGQLEVLAKSELYKINLIANGAQYKYDGQEHVASGFSNSMEFEFEGRTYTVVGCTSQAKSTDWKDGGYNTQLDDSNLKVLSWDGTDATSLFEINYTPSKLIIDKREITLTSGTSEKEYDGDVLKNYDVNISGDGFAQGESFKYSGFPEISYVGSVSNDFEYSPSTDATKLKNYNVVKECGTLTIKDRGSSDKYSINLISKGLNAKYNGIEQSVNGFENQQFTFNGHQYEVFGYFSSAKSKDVISTQTVIEIAEEHGVKDSNGADVSAQFDVSTTPADFIISPLNVTFTSKSAVKAYDGKQLQSSEVTISGDDLPYGEGFDFSGFYKITNVDESGSKNNSFSYNAKTGTKVVNYDITTIYGNLQITPKNISDDNIEPAVDKNPMYDTHVLSAIDDAGFKLNYGISAEESIALIYNQDFSITSGITGTNAGNYNLLISGIGNYTGSRDFQWTIAKRPISEVGTDKPLTEFNVTFGDDTPNGKIKYDTAAHTPDIDKIEIAFVANNGETVSMQLPAGSYSNNTEAQKNAGDYNLVVNANESSNFAGINEVVYWTIQRGSINKITITGAKNSYPYTGETYTVPSAGQPSFVAAADIAEGYSANIFDIDKLNNKPTDFSVSKADKGEYPLGLNGKTWAYEDDNVDVEQIVIEDGGLIISENPRLTISVVSSVTGDAALGNTINYSVTIKNNYNDTCNADLSSTIFNSPISLEFTADEEKQLSYDHLISASDFDNSGSPSFLATFTITPANAGDAPSVDNAATALKRTQVAKPSTKQETYDKTEKGYWDTDQYTVTEDAKKTTVGSYEALFTLNSNAFEWSDKSRDPVSVEWQIIPRTLTITAEDTEIWYGESPHCDGYTVGDGQLLDGDTIESIGGEISYSYNYSQFGNAGNYSITPSLGSALSTNYTATYVDGKLTVNKKLVEISSWGTTSKKYDGVAYSSNITMNKAREEDNVAVVPSFKLGDELISAPINAGTYTMLADSLTGTAANNYELSTSPSTTVTIDKRNVKLTSGSATQEYNGSALSNTIVTESTDENFDSILEADKDKISYSGFATIIYPGSTDNSFEITKSSDIDTNYEISSSYGTLTINNRNTKYAISMESVGDSTVDYDGTEHTLSGFFATEFTFDGVVYEVTGLVSSVSATNAGTYPTEKSGTAVVKVKDKETTCPDLIDQFNITYIAHNLIINKVATSVTDAPTPIPSLVYTGTATTIANAGTASPGGLMYYAVSTSASAPDKSDAIWKTSIDTKTDANTYYVYYYSKANDANYIDSTIGSITSTIEKADNPMTYEPDPVTTNFSTTATTIPLVVPTDAVGTVTFSSTDSDDFSVGPQNLVIPANKAANTYTINVKATATGNSNYKNGSITAELKIIINKISNSSFAFAPGSTSSDYSSSLLSADFTAAQNNKGTVTYSAEGYTITGNTISWETAKNAGTYNIAITATDPGDTNYSETSITSTFTLTINRLTPTVAWTGVLESAYELTKEDSGDTLFDFATNGISVTKTNTDAGASITHSLTSAPSGVSINNDGQIIFDSTAEAKTYDLLVVATCASTTNFNEASSTTPIKIDLIEEVTFKLNYIVCVWGIGQDCIDEARDEEGNYKNTDNSLTFGPAIGSAKACLHVDGSTVHGSDAGGHCICEDSWETIIDNCNSGNAGYYSNCLDYGCAKDVPINLNSDIVGTTSTEATECSVLYNSIKNIYKKWNNNYNENNCESANWSTSRIRATLNGKENLSPFSPSTYAGNDCLDASKCLLSCFPSVLQTAIKPKYMRVPTQWNITESDSYQITSSTEINDKLWLMNANEIYLNPYPMHKDYRKQYSKALKLGISTSSYRNNMAYNESDSIYSYSSLWLRSPYRQSYRCLAGYVRDDGSLGQHYVNKTDRGLSPCFCLGPSS